MMSNRIFVQRRVIEPSRSRATGPAGVFIAALVACVVMAPQPVSAQIVPGGDTVEDSDGTPVTIGDWGFQWWQWVFGIDSTSRDHWSDTTGAKQNFIQMPPVFFTCGAAGPAGGVPITRRFTVPADYYILAGLSTGGVYYEIGIDPPNICTELIGADIDQTSSLSFSLDGVPISQADLFNNHRETSALDLTAVIAPGNPYFPPGSYPGSCADGYFVMIEPLPPGPHVIECGFTHPNGGLLDHTNEIYVLEDVLDFVEAEFDGVDGVDGIGGAREVALSPDGAHAYVTGSIDNALAVFERDANTGELSFVERHEDGVAGIYGLELAASVTVTRPDGAHVYVLSGGDDKSLVVFERDPVFGTLTLVEVIASPFPGYGQSARGAMSPDGAHFYIHTTIQEPINNFDEDRVIAFARDPVTGLLTPVGLHQNYVGGVEGLNFAGGLEVSPDGDHVYASSRLDNAIVLFARDSGTGVLTFVESHYASVNGLVSADDLALSPDGAHVYVADNSGHHLAVYSRNVGTGALTFVEIHQDGVAGVDGLRGASGVTLNPDGTHVFVASVSDDAVAVFERDAGTGSLTFVDLQRDKTYGVDGLNVSGGGVVSADGAHYYAVGYGAGFPDGSIAAFEIVPEPSFGLLLLSGNVLLVFLRRQGVRR
jgi:6-phosphogluconolactonase (cycloisomerase 2 family)